MNERSPTLRCVCGLHRDGEDHAASMPPKSLGRRTAIGYMSRPALAALVGTIVPAAVPRAAKATPAPVEKAEVNIGFLPIVCATPLIHAQESGLFAAEGLKVTLHKAASWAVVRDKTVSGEFDGALMLAPMPLAMSMGAGARRIAMDVPGLSNTNGSAITLHRKHAGNRDPRNWKGFKLGIPFEYSMQNLLLRRYLLASGIDPDKDVQLRVMPPPDMISNMRSNNLDGFILAEPFNARAVYDEIGFTHLLSSELWDGHPCCSFAFTKVFATTNRGTFGAVMRALFRATGFLNIPENRKGVAEVLAQKQYLNQPAVVVAQGLTGHFADGLGNIRNVPNRVSFEAFPWQSMALWILMQMRTMGMIDPSENLKELAESVFDVSRARQHMAEAGLRAPRGNRQVHIVMGRRYEPE